ncbi:hypothetical protein P5V15_012831 [Pogonomyrmex californicus]
MRSLSGNKASEEILRVKWLSLLPPNAQRFLKIFSAPNLDELAVAADHLLEGSNSSYVMSTSHPTRPSALAARSQISLTLAVENFLACATRRVLLPSAIRCSTPCSFKVNQPSEQPLN